MIFGLALLNEFLFKFALDKILSTCKNDFSQLRNEMVRYPNFTEVRQFPSIGRISLPYRFSFFGFFQKNCKIFAKILEKSETIRYLNFTEFRQFMNIARISLPYRFVFFIPRSKRNSLMGGQNFAGAYKILLTT